MARKISKAWKTLLHYRSKKNLLHDSIWATCCVMSVKLKNSLFPLFLFLKFLPIGYQFYFWMVGNFFDPIVCNEKRSNLVSICLCLPRFVTNSVVSNRASLMTDISAKKIEAINTKIGLVRFDISDQDFYELFPRQFNDSKCVWSNQNCNEIITQLFKAWRK